MTVKTINKDLTQEFDTLSIQVSLNGLSFCILNTIENSIRYSDTLLFDKERSPYDLRKALATLFERHSLIQKKFSEVIVIHRNTLFSLVPKPFFDVDAMPNYLKFNTRILATDYIAHDEIDGHDMVNVYVPFVNVNNYVYDIFGEFTFKHNGTVMIEALLKGNTLANEPTCYLHIAAQQMDITVIEKKKLLLFNSFIFNTKEDLIYYLLFTIEQLGLDAEKLKLKLFGSIEEGDSLYAICYKYIKNVSIFTPPTSSFQFSGKGKETIDFTLLNAL